MVDSGCILQYSKRYEMASRVVVVAVDSCEARELKGVMRVGSMVRAL
jgi:hypothetical protein